MEMHVVTYNVHYDNFTNALNYADGLAVLGVFFEVGNSPNTNLYLETITKVLPSIKTPGSSIQVDLSPMGLFPPLDTRLSYRYQGSLTTPPCSEVVTWTLFGESVTVSEDQIEAFRALLSSERDEKSNAPLPMVDNFRPTQPLHGREIVLHF